MTHFLVLVLFGTGYWQVAPRQGNRVHMVYRSQHDKVLGGYFQKSRGDFFEAQCLGGTPAFVANEKQARRLIEACPE